MSSSCRQRHLSCWQRSQASNFATSLADWLAAALAAAAAGRAASILGYAGCLGPACAAGWCWLGLWSLSLLVREERCRPSPPLSAFSRFSARETCLKRGGSLDR
eukprot:SAG25_NODE_76_length_16934_cov_51.463202_8_plen_104_part_00